MLLVRPKPRADESAYGYFLSLAQWNGLSSLAPVVGAGGAKVALSAASCCLGLDYGALLTLPPPLPPWIQDRWLGYHGPRRVFNLRRIRFCPLCFDEGAYHRHYWMFALAGACTCHGVLLREHCDQCGRTFNWRGFTSWACTCGRQFAVMRDEPAPAVLSEFSRLFSCRNISGITGRFAGIAQYFAPMSRERRVLALHEVGTIAYRGGAGNARKPKGLYQLSACNLYMLELAEFFTDWPSGMQPDLERCIRATEGAPLVWRLAPMIDSLYGPRLRDHDFDFLRAEFASYVAPRWHGPMSRQYRRILGPYLR